MTYHSGRVFLLSVVVSLVALTAVYSLSYACFASEEAETFDPVVSSSSSDAGTDAGQVESLPDKAGDESSSEEDFTSSSESESVPDESGSSEGNTSLPEDGGVSSLPDDDFGEEIDPPEIEIPPPDFEIDPGMTLDPEIEAENRLRDDVRYIRIYLEFFLFGFLPILCAIVIICLFCRWFYRTFIDSALR